MEVTKINKVRVFLFQKEELPDPNPEFTPMEVSDFYAMKYPELINCKPLIKENTNEKITFEFQTTMGSKG